MWLSKALKLPFSIDKLYVKIDRVDRFRKVLFSSQYKNKSFKIMF